MNVFILDHEGESLDQLLALVSESKKINEVTVLKKVETLLKKAEDEKPELIFIRVDCNDIPGLQTCKMIKTMDLDILVVFIAEDTDYVLDAYEIGADGYLLYPIKQKDLDNILNVNYRSQKSFYLCESY